MRRLLAWTGVVAISLSAGCGKKPDATGGAPPPPVTADQKGPSNPGPIDPATAGTIKGVVKLEGWLRPDVTEPMGGVPACAANHPNGLPLQETLVMGEGQTLANVIVFISNGLGNRSFDVPKDQVAFDQVGCVYKPHARAIRVNQPLLVRNGDNLLHNVRAKPAFNAEFNQMQHTKGSQDLFTFPVPEVGIYVKCDVHPWMQAYLHVMSHPFFHLTEKDGAYTISGLPPGDYEIQAWHEKFQKAPLVAKVKVEAKATVTQDFTFKGGKKPE